MPPERKTIFVGIDYGTTYSGIAYVLSTDREGQGIEIVTSWPGLDNPNGLAEKVPSKIAYLREDAATSASDGAKEVLWGYEVKSTSVSRGYDTFSWTKLLLDTEENNMDYVDLDTSQDASLLRLPKGKQAVDVVTDYLRNLYKHCMAMLEKRYEAVLGMTPIEFWFTLPAIWSDKAKNSTHDAATAAGFGSRQSDSISMISEPEAGVLAAIKSQMKITKELFTPGTGLMVCDCGGGTVDLTSYEIQQLEPSLELRESCAGNGRKCGSTFIDRNLYHLMFRRYGQAFQNLPAKRIGPGSRFMESFEGQKRAFSRDSAKTDVSIELRMPALDENNLHTDTYDTEYAEVKLTWHDLDRCFKPVVDQIIDLIHQQVRDTELSGAPRIETIIMVGGFSDSRYLWEAVREWGLARNIGLIGPEKPWSAIVRGAALRGLEGSKVPVVRCRRHYGYTIERKFDDFKDSRDVDSTYEDQGALMVKGVMSWFYNKNDRIEQGKPKTVEVTQYYRQRRHRKTTRLNIYYCTLTKPPDKKSKLMTKLLGKVEINTDDIDLTACDFNWRVNTKNVVYHKYKEYQIPVIISIALCGDDGLMEVTVEWRGRRCGNAKFNFDT